VGYKCDRCHDSGFVAGGEDSLPWPVVLRKAKERPAWADLPRKLGKLNCFKCNAAPLPPRRTDPATRVDLSAALGQSAAGDPPKRRRGRPKGSKNRPKD